VRPDGKCEYYNWSSRLEIQSPTPAEATLPMAIGEGTIEDLQKAYAHLYKR